MATWTFGDWTTLQELAAGSVFETRDGERLFKSAYPMGRFRREPSTTMMICFQLQNGKEFVCPNSKEVRPLLLEDPQ